MTLNLIEFIQYNIKVIKKKKQVENNEPFVYGMLTLILMFLSFDYRFLEPILSCWVRALPCPTLPPSCRLWRGTFHSAGSPMKGHS